MRDLERAVIRARLAASADAIWVAMCVATCVVALGCDRGGDVGPRCENAVRHISLGVIPPDAPGQPSAEERAAIEVVIAAGVAQCKREGLTRAQADCVLAVSGVGAASWRKLAECPAIAARKPSWLRIPSPEMLDLMEHAERRRRDRRAADEAPADEAPADEPTHETSADEAPADEPTAGEPATAPE